MASNAQPDTGTSPAASASTTSNNDEHQHVRPMTRAFLARFCSAQFSDSKDIFASGAVNSLVAMQLVLFVEKSFGFTVEDDQLSIDHFRSVDAIAALVARHRSRSLPSGLDASVATPQETQR